MKADLFVEFNGRQVDCGQFADRIKAEWKAAGNKVKDAKDVKIYYKPDDGNVYYVINGGFKGSFDA
ncbi:MAG: DUF6465 family protein [Clostridiales bacterium]|jgi:hypothetical protein|nr:DUF6465 family protein [Clostridiales bacterium]